MSKRDKYPDKDARDFVINALKHKGITLRDIANIAYRLEKDYVYGLSVGTCEKTVDKVLDKRDVLSICMTGLELDRLAQENLLREPLLSIVKNDLGLFSVDEVFGSAICNLFFTIAVTNYGFIDKKKIGKIKELDESKTDCNTFIDDIVGALAAATAAKIAHDHNGD